jgi:hypothetical protein
MKVDFINYLKKCINEKEISHAFLVEVKDDSIISSIYEELKKLSIVGNIKIENNPSIIVVNPDNNIIDREKILDIQERFKTKTFDDTYKVYFINNANCMNLSSANKLLKFLEEPDQKIIGFLFTSDINLILPTIKSRCEIFKIKEDSTSLNSQYTDELSKLINLYNKPICDIMYEIRFLKELDKSSLGILLNEYKTYLMANLINDINFNKKVKLIKKLDEYINRIDSNVNVDLIFDSLCIEMGS